MANQFLTDTRVVSIEPHEGADTMGETVPPEWPRFLFAADGRSQQFSSQEEADATGETWHRTPQEAQQAQQASQARQQASPPPPPPDDEDEGSPGADRPHTPRSRR